MFSNESVVSDNNKHLLNFGNKKSVARLLAVQILYMTQNNQHYCLNNIDLMIDNVALFQKAKFNRSFLRLLVNMVLQCGNKIDPLIDNAIEKNISKSRINFLNRIIIIVAVTEMYHFSETPHYAIMSDFTYIANFFVNDLDVKFINAILGSLKNLIN